MEASQVAACIIVIMEVVVVVASHGDGVYAPPTRSSAARMSRTSSVRLGASPGCYVQLRVGPTRPQFFRVAVDNDDEDAARGDSDRDAIVIDHWAEYGNSPATTSSSESFNRTQTKATMEIVPPARMRVAQYVSLHPAAPDQPRLPLAMGKSLLKKLILHGDQGIVHLQLQGVEYGLWRYKAYYRGGSRPPDPTDPDETPVQLQDVGIVTDDTMVAISPYSSSEGSRGSVNGTLENPGIGAHGEALYNLLALALSQSTDNAAPVNRAVMQPSSLLLHGPSGSGKSTLVRLIASSLGANVLSLDCSLLATPQFRIEDVFTAALRIQPCLILLEDLELIFPRAVDETKYKLVCRFVACLDRIRSMPSVRVAVIGNVTTLRALNGKIRQVFEEEVALEVPDKTWTMRLFESLLPSPDSVCGSLKFAVAVKYGQRPSNIVSLAHRLQEHGSLTAGPDSAQLRSDIEKFGREIATTSSSADALRTSVPDVRWDDIGGLASVKQSLQEMVVWPLERPQVFLRMGITPPLGMLLHGPPGTGKTMLAKAAARASGCNFLNVSASDLMKAEFGESEKAITRVFDTARALSPCMVFIDEFQSLFGNRTTAGVTTSRMISQLLVEMDALKLLADDESSPSNRASDSVAATSQVAGNRVFVLAATNALNAIDPAFLQPGRFENILYVGLPTVDERLAILQLQQQKMPWHNDVDTEYLAEATEGANAASIVALCQSAAMKAIQRIDVADMSQLIEMQDFLLALKSGSFAFSQREDFHCE